MSNRVIEPFYTVNLPLTDSYHDYLVNSLQVPQEAAAYLEAILEEEDPEPELLGKALGNVVEALGKAGAPFEATNVHQKQLEQVLSLAGSQTVYGLASWLNELGLKLTVTVSEEIET